MRRRTSIALLLILSAACAPDQLVVVVDTDAAPFEQVPATSGPLLPGERRFAPAAVIDSVRIDVLDETGQSFDACELGSITQEQWPLSFGISADAQARYLRVRGFRRALAQSSDARGLRKLCGRDLDPGAVAVLSEPPPAVTIERVVELSKIDDVRRVGLLLPLSCIGAPASFLEHTSCTGGATLPPAKARFEDMSQWSDAPPESNPSSRVGQSPFSLLSGCTNKPPSGPLIESARCIPGGLTIQGDLTVTDAQAGLETRPLRAVFLSPFFLDQDEVALRRYRLFQERAVQKLVPLKAPFPGAVFDPVLGLFERDNCTWDLKFSNAAALPVNCVDVRDARIACQLSGGDLPTEAQWEHAARGLGAGFRYPWGDTKPEQSERCCMSAIRRLPRMMGDPEDPPPSDMDRCGEHGPAAVGSYSNQSCPDGGDETAEGIRDLGGNVSEYVLDDFQPYSARCGLAYGLKQDPVCEVPFIGQTLLRGGKFYDFLTDYARPSRRKLLTRHVGIDQKSSYPGADAGFRCAYKDR
jgi:formylglycine-generating enzyme required for sulfatase activity